MTDWQPIDTAPMDGRVIVTDGFVVGEAAYYSAYEGWWWAGSHPLDATDGQLAYDPTHWMPLPPPPKDDTTA